MRTGSCRSPRHVEREVENVGESIRRTPWYPFTLPSPRLGARSKELFCARKNSKKKNESVNSLFDGERGSRKIKRRKEGEERSDDGMWSGKLQR